MKVRNLSRSVAGERAAGWVVRITGRVIASVQKLLQGQRFDCVRKPDIDVVDGYIQPGHPARPKYDSDRAGIRRLALKIGVARRCAERRRVDDVRRKGGRGDAGRCAIRLARRRRRPLVDEIMVAGIVRELERRRRRQEQLGDCGRANRFCPVGAQLYVLGRLPTHSLSPRRCGAGNRVVHASSGAFQFEPVQGRNILRRGENGDQGFAVHLVGNVGTLDSRGRNLTKI